MDIKIRYRFDGGQTCQPIGSGVDSIATPVQIPIATDATIRVEIVSAWSRRIVRPNVDISGATAWRFAIFNSYGDGSGMLFATRNVDHAGAGWAFSWRESGTSELYNALGTEPARVFRAELQGYASQTSALPVVVFSFPFRVGNRRGDIVAISPIEQFEERDPVAMAALDAHATAGNAHTDIRDAIAAHEARRDNPHGVTAKQVGADSVGTAAGAVAAHNEDGAAHGDIRAAVSSAQQQADSALQNSIVAHNLAVEVEGNLNSHKDDKNNPHAVTASQVGADASGTAAKAVGEHNTSKDAHADIRADKLDKENETTSLSLRQDDVGFIVADTAGACHATFNPTGIAHNVPDSVNHTLSFPSKDGVLALTSDISDHTTNTENPHSVKEVQVSTATTERTDRAFLRADYNYAGRPWYVDAKVTDRVLFTADTTRIDYLFVARKLLALYITSWGNAGGHLILEGSTANKDANGLTLQTIGGTNNKSGIEINPATFTTIKGDLNVASRAAVTTGSLQKTASAGDLTADGTITAKTGMKVTKTEGETTTDVMSVDSRGATLSVPFTARMGATILNGITTDRAIDFTEVSTDLLNEFDIWTFGKPSYIMNVGSCNGQTITFNAPYIYNQGRLDIPSVSRSSVYMFYNETSNDIVVSFELTEKEGDASDGVVFLYNDKAIFFQRTIRQGCFVAVRVSIMNTDTNISGKRAYLVCAEDMGHFQDLP